MNWKKILMYIIIILTIAIVLGVGYYIYVNNSKEEVLEITPQEELSDESLRQTIVTLYFLNIDTGELYPEARQIDAKNLLLEPYRVLLDLLIEGPKNEKLVKLIPEGTTIKNVIKEGSTLIIDFSEDFIKNQVLGKEQEEIIVKSIVNTITELTEIEQVLIKIEGAGEKEFPDGELSFSKAFSRMN